MDPVGVGTRSAVPSSLPLSSGQHEPDRTRRAGGRGNDRQPGGAHLAEIGLAAAGRLGEVDERLVARVRVDRRHQALLDAESVVQDLGQRCQAVRGARRVRDHGVLRRVEHRVVDTHADGRVGVTARRGDHDPLDAAAEVLRRVLAAGEDAGRLDHDVDVVVGPRDLVGVHHAEAGNVATVDREAVRRSLRPSGGACRRRSRA